MAASVTSAVSSHRPADVGRTTFGGRAVKVRLARMCAGLPTVRRYALAPADLHNVHVVPVDCVAPALVTPFGAGKRSILDCGGRHIPVSVG